jgi:hypothetical protein
MKDRNKIALMMFFVLLLFSAQAQIPLTVHLQDFTLIKNSQIYDITEFDKEIYIATSKGLFKYDGQELYAFSVENGLKDDEVFNFQVYNNKLWFNSIMGRLFYLPVREKNITEYTDLQDYIKTFFWYEGKLFYTNNVSELCIWSMQERKKTVVSKTYNVLDYKVKNEKLYLLHAGFEFSVLSLINYTLQKFPSHNPDNSYTIPVRNRSTDKPDKIYSFFRQKLAEINPNTQEIQELPVQEKGIIYAMYPTKELILIGTQQGLYQYQNRKTECILPDIFVTNIIKDSEGTFWITTFNGEIYLIPDLELKTKFYKDKNIALNLRKLYVFKNNVLCGTNTGEALLNHEVFTPVKKNYEVGKLNRILNITADNSKVYVVRDDGFFICDIPAQTAEYINTKYTLKRLLVTDEPYYLVGAYYSVSFMDKKTHKNIRQFNCSRIADLVLFDNKPLLCTYHNVYFVHSDTLTEVLKNEYQKSRIRFAYYDTHYKHLYIIHQKGIHVYNHQLQRIKTIHLAQNYSINKIQTYNEKTYIATQSGVLVVTPNTDKPVPVQNLYPLNVYDIFIHQDTLHLVSDAGYGYIPVQKLNIQLPDFQVEYRVKEKYLLNMQEAVYMRYPENVLEIKAIPKTIKFRSAVHFTHKVIGEKTEADTRYNLLTIPLIQSGMYYIQIKTNIEGNVIHEDTIRTEFTLPLWKDKNFKIFMLIIVLILAALIYMEYLIRKEKRKSFQEKQQNENLKFQLQAVQSRLNPHFIFNGLQSLQYLVVSNQNHLAKTYLNDFAVLTRKFLNYSQQEFCTIEEEMSILKHYLSLENIAHENKIQYKIITQIEDEMILQQPIIPSLILQPLVENIFKHAFTENYPDPKIEIRFTEDTLKNRLIIETEDNGTGINDEVLPNSKGLLLIKDRLKIINQTYNAQHTIIIKNAEKYPTGTLCRLILQFNAL